MAWLVLSWPWLSGTVTIPWDAKAHWQPFVQFIARAFADGDGPLWTPNVFSGWPTVADPQSGVFTPILLALAFLDPAPSFRAIDGAVLAMLGLGGLAVIGYCHDRGWAGPAAVIGALAFAFGASAAWRVQHLGQILSLAWFPMALFFLERALMRRSVAWGSLAGIAAGLMLIGRDQVSLIAGYALLARVVWHWLARPGRWQRFGASVIPTGAAGLLAVLLAAVPVALSALLALETNRPTIDLEGAGRGSLHPALLLTALIPDVFAASGPMAAYWGPPSFAWSGTGLFLAQNMGVLYAGAVPILLVVWGTVRGWAWTGGLGATAALLAVTLAYALGWYTPVFRWLYEWLPFVDHYRRPADATFVAGALMALLAAGLLHRFLAAPAPVRAAVAVAGLAVAALVAIAAALAHRFDRLADTPILPACAWIAAAAVALWATRRARLAWRRPAGVALVALLTADLAVNNGPNGSTALPPDAYEMLRPDTANETIAALRARLAAAAAPDRRDRVELAGLGFAWPNASLVHGLDHTLGYNPLRLLSYHQAVGTGDTVALPDQRVFTALFPSYRSTLADLLGLRFIVTGVPVEAIDPSLRPGDLVPLGRTGDGHLYENPRAFPRVHFAGAAQDADFAAIVRTGTWPDVDLRATVLLEGAATTAATPPARGTARLVRYRNGEVVVAVEADGAGHVVLADPWHAWWEAEIDGRRIPILRANVLFRAVAVPAGRHTVRFVFRPFRGAWRQIAG